MSRSSGSAVIRHCCVAGSVRHVNSTSAAHPSATRRYFVTEPRHRRPTTSTRCTDRRAVRELRNGDTPVLNVRRIAFDRSCIRRMTFTVIQGHWKWHEWIGHMILPISGVLCVVTMCRSRVISLTLPHLGCMLLAVGRLTLKSLSFLENSCD